MPEATNMPSYYEQAVTLYGANLELLKLKAARVALMVAVGILAGLSMRPVWAAIAADFAVFTLADGIAWVFSKWMMRRLGIEDPRELRRSGIGGGR